MWRPMAEAEAPSCDVAREDIHLHYQAIAVNSQGSVAYGVDYGGIRSAPPRCSRMAWRRSRISRAMASAWNLLLRAIRFRLISSGSGSPCRVSRSTRNMRVCSMSGCWARKLRIGSAAAGSKNLKGKGLQFAQCVSDKAAGRFICLYDSGCRCIQNKDGVCCEVEQLAAAFKIVKAVA